MYGDLANRFPSYHHLVSEMPSPMHSPVSGRRPSDRRGSDRRGSERRGSGLDSRRGSIDPLRLIRMDKSVSCSCLSHFLVQRRQGDPHSWL